MSEINGILYLSKPSCIQAVTTVLAIVDRAFFQVEEQKNPVPMGGGKALSNDTLRTAAPLSHQRAISSDPDVISSYFDLLEQTIEDNGLERKPGNIFNPLTTNDAFGIVRFWLHVISRHNPL